MKIKDNKPIKFRAFSKRFVIDVFEDNLHLNHLIYWDKPVKEFLKSYDVEIRQLEDDEVVTRM